MKEHENIIVFGKNRTNYYPIKEKRASGGLARSKYDINASNTGKRDVYNSMKGIDSGKIEELRVPRSIQKFNTEVGLHPTQKPVALFEYLIKTYTNENEIVLDNVAGSCTTAIAAKNTNRKWICIEKEEKYCDISVERIKNHVVQN